MEENIIQIINNIQKEKNQRYNINDIPLDIIIEFNKKHFNNFKNILLENALEYTNKNKTIYYENLIKNNNTGELLKDTLFQATTTKYAIMNIYNKLNPENNIEFIFINDLYRNILLSIIDPYLNDTNQKNEIIDKIIFTDSYDNVIYKECSFINEEDINIYKYLLTRFILSDNFLYLESLKIEKEIDELLDELVEENEEDLMDYNLDDIEEYETEIDEEILDYIYNCIYQNQYNLPRDKNLRYRIYDTFITYNMFIRSQTYDLTHLEDNDKILELKKINPICLLEKK